MRMIKRETMAAMLLDRQGAEVYFALFYVRKPDTKKEASQWPMFATRSLDELCEALMEPAMAMVYLGDPCAK